jgi:hypothetical protein
MCRTVLSGIVDSIAHRYARDREVFVWGEEHLLLRSWRKGRHGIAEDYEVKGRN